VPQLFCEDDGQGQVAPYQNFILMGQNFGAAPHFFVAIQQNLLAPYKWSKQQNKLFTRQNFSSRAKIKIK